MSCKLLAAMQRPLGGRRLAQPLFLLARAPLHLAGMEAESLHSQPAPRRGGDEGGG